MRNVSHHVGFWVPIVAFSLVARAYGSGTDSCGLDRPQLVCSVATSLVEGADAVSFPVSTTNPQAQSFVNQGVAQLFAYQNAEAERSFRQAALLDHRCAMAYWGMAMSRLPDETAAQGPLQIAIVFASSPAISSRETAYLKLLKRYLEAGPDNDEARRRQVVEDLETLLIQNPDDQTARALLARQLRSNREIGMPSGSPLAIDALLRLVLADEPRHPCEIERLRLWADSEPSYVLDIASESPSMPSSMPAWHLRGHVFERLGRYEEACWRYEAAARVGLARARNESLIPDQIAGFAHNRECQARCLAASGHVRDAIAMARTLISLPGHPQFNAAETLGGSRHTGRHLLGDLLSRYEMWDDLLSLADSGAFAPSDDPTEKAYRQRLIGRASFALGNVERGRQALARLQDLAKSAAESADKPAPNLSAATNELRALDLISTGSVDEGLAILRQVPDLDPLRLAIILRENHREEEAENLVADRIEQHPQDPLPRAVLAWMSWSADRMQEAEQSLRDLIDMSAGIDLDVPAFSRLGTLTSALGLPADWRTQRSRPVNSSPRPPIETLGPAVWEPVERPPGLCGMPPIPNGRSHNSGASRWW